MEYTFLTEIASAVQDQGALSKAEVMEAWGLGEEEYREIQARLSRDPDIEPGAPGTGGFTARHRRGRFPEESAGGPLLLREGWERHAVERLVDLLPHAVLEDLLADLLYTLRQVRQRTEGADRRGTKRELATALVLQHGIDLFGAVPVREAVAQGALRVLCNCEVLTTGFDAPRVSHVIMARPTVSRVLYEQIVGRGLRGPRFGGTPTCVVVDCEDNYKGGRPILGYESFRKVWSGGKAPAVPARG